ncbi:MAG: sporulation protein YabP [Ruminococcaceae bacterium]|nr:sporulation protein YabP [Oscillospiraceae bacterium]
MEERKIPHNLILENKNRLSITQVADVDTFDEGKIVLFTADDTIIIEGYDLHIQKLDVLGGELSIEGEVVSILYTGREGSNRGSKGFFKKILK